MRVGQYRVEGLFWVRVGQGEGVQSGGAVLGGAGVQSGGAVLGAGGAVQSGGAVLGAGGAGCGWGSTEWRGCSGCGWGSTEWRGCSGCGWGRVRVGQYRVEGLFWVRVGQGAGGAVQSGGAVTGAGGEAFRSFPLLLDQLDDVLILQDVVFAHLLRVVLHRQAPHQSTAGRETLV